MTRGGVRGGVKTRESGLIQEQASAALDGRTVHDIPDVTPTPDPSPQGGGGVRASRMRRRKDAHPFVRSHAPVMSRASVSRLMATFAAAKMSDASRSVIQSEAGLGISGRIVADGGRGGAG